ncbi:RNase H domain-containing protein [Trichonephila clavipes]|uniref:RNase H domain-containing protein n=1 Tax=Trichonephila clavipes TaxID=2585209 RepID=A0A8X6WD41_TRICX|nr:RNase H domain-containing protein [Trichonephila clavipes]
MVKGYFNLRGWESNVPGRYISRSSGLTSLLGLLWDLDKDTLKCNLNYSGVVRPLTYLSENSDDLVPLSPAMFLMENRNLDVNDIDYRDTVNLRKSDLLTELRLGEIILIGDDIRKRMHRPLAKVIRLIPGKDGKIRTVELKTRNGTMLRPIQRACPLELHSTETPDDPLNAIVHLLILFLLFLVICFQIPTTPVASCLEYPGMDGSSRHQRNYTSSTRPYMFLSPSAFVEDIVLWKSDSDLTKLESDIILVPEDIRNFTLDHKLNFNPTKYIVSFVITNRKLYNFYPIFSYNQTLTVDKHPKYLGFVLEPEILRNKHIDNIVLKARKWLNILRYISGRDWEANAVTLRNTYVLLIAWNIILEYGVPVHCSVSITNLQKLKWVQLSAALIITSLKKYLSQRYNTFQGGPTAILALEDLKNRPFNQLVSINLTIGVDEPHHLSQCLDPADELDGVFFHPELAVHLNKQTELPAYLKQLALERIGDILIGLVQVYTDGSRDDYYRSASRTYIKPQDHILRIQRRNPDGSSVFCSELIAIDKALGSLDSLQNEKKKIWILSDSRSAIQHLSNW